ncbi:MAG: family 16 glycoside hydrolase [Anaerolineaceae bacterium]
MKNHSNKGQGIIEYVILLILIGVISAAALKLAGVNIGTAFTKISTAITGKTKTFLDDPFNNLTGWESIFGPNNWKITNGFLTTTSAGDQRIMEAANLPNDYVINTTAQLLNGGGYGVMFRLTQSGNTYGGYSFQLDSGYGNKFVLRKYATNGAEISTPIAVAKPPAGFDFNASHKVSIAVVGNTYTISVDGVKVMTASDNTYSSGGAGLRTWWTSKVKVDDFSVTAP